MRLVNWTIIAVMLLVVPIVRAQTTETDAQRLVAAKKFSAARAAYERLAAADPSNTGYELWVARLSAWIGDYRRALQIYDSVLTRKPDNNEALLGKAFVQMWRRRYGAARRTLESAAVNGRHDIGFLITKINFYRYQRLYDKARETLAVAKEIAPGNPELAELEQMLAGARSGTFRAGCEQSYEPFTATVTGCFVNYTYERGADRIQTGVQAGTRFGRFYRELNVNWNRTLNNQFSVNVNAAAEPRSPLNLDLNFSASYQPASKLTATVNYRFWRYDRKNINIFSASASYSLGRRSQVSGTFYATSSPVALLRYNRMVTDKLSFGLSLVRTFRGRAVTAGFDQTALAATARYEITKNMTLSASYGVSQKGTEPRRSIYGFGFTITK